MKLESDDFKVICKKCKSNNVNIRGNSYGGCPTCGPSISLELICNNCKNFENVDWSWPE